MLDLLFAKPSLDSLPEAEIQLVRTLRLWAVIRQSGQCPTRSVAERVGERGAAAHEQLELAEVAPVWAEGFALSPLCCRRLSHDEALLAEMLRLGRLGDRPAFDRLLAEMIPADARERLFVSAKVLSRYLSSA